MKNIIKAGALVAASVWLSACGSNSLNQIVNNIDVRTYEHPETHHNYIEVKAQIDSSNMVFPTAFLTVVDPKNPQVELGTIQLQSDFNGKNMMTVNADISGFRLGDYVAESKLPNGNPLPVSGLSKIYALNVKGGKSRIYIAEHQGQVVVGVALALQQFDGLAKTLPNSNLFFALPETSGVSGLGGFFTGTGSSTSGVAIFAKTPLVNPMGKMTRVMASEGPKFKVSKPTSTQLMKTQYFFWDLNRKGGQLNLAK